MKNRKIRVNAVSPGGISTPMFSGHGMGLHWHSAHFIFIQEKIVKKIFLLLIVCCHIYFDITMVFLLFNKREITEFEWYLRDHLFRQSNQGREKFQKDQLGKEMLNSYLRYRTSNLEKLNELIDIITENLISRQVLQSRDGQIPTTN